MRNRIAGTALAVSVLFQSINVFAVQELYTDTVQWTAPSEAGSCIGNMYTQIADNDGTVEISLDNAGMWEFIKGGSTEDIADITTRRTIDGKKVRVNKKYFYNADYYMPAVYVSVPEQSDSLTQPVDISFKYMVDGTSGLSVYPVSENGAWSSRWTGAIIYA